MSVSRNTVYSTFVCKQCEELLSGAIKHAQTASLNKKKKANRQVSWPQLISFLHCNTEVKAERGSMCYDIMLEYFILLSVLYINIVV